MHRGGSDFGGLHLLGPDVIPVLHMNDDPDLPCEKFSDADHVYPGGGVAPLKELFRTIRSLGLRVNRSLELFNRRYWKLDTLTVAQRPGEDRVRGRRGPTMNLVGDSRHDGYFARNENFRTRSDDLPTYVALFP